MEWVIRKTHLTDASEILETIVQDLNNFLGPLVATTAENGTPPGKWSTESGWKSY
jgi:hypothetical protein